MQLNVKYRKVEDLIPYVNNSRKHSDEQIAQISASIKEFGWTNPILIDGTNSIIAGHGRLMAARKLKMDEVPTIELDHLTDTQRKALVIADNKLALNADWDTALLTIELDDLLKDGFALDILGFNEQEIKTIMQEVNFDAGSEEDQGKLDQLDPKWICCPHCGKEFDAREA
jgi:ParB-like chromosome segregation protein Spo0J